MIYGFDFALCANVVSMQGLKQFMETIESGSFDQTRTEPNFQNDTNSLGNLRALSRF